jgi:hypothetical protein
MTMHPAPLVGAGLSAVHANTLQALNDIYDDYLKTGIYFTHGDWYERFGETPLLTVSSTRTHMREVAKDLKRPFVVVDGRRHWRSGGVEGEFQAQVTLPRQKQTQILMTPIFVIGKETTNRYRASDNAVSYKVSASVAYAWFIGDMGAKAFEAWFKYTQEQPECRKVLKLDV